jgi:uncharacterized paraquat-inducible protein A
MSIRNKILTFLKALWFHIGSGMPKSTQEEINKRFDVCQKCDMFDNKGSQCLVCGCNLSTKKVFLNKLAWSDQHCPLKKW